MSESTFDQILSEVSTFAQSAKDLAFLQKFIVEIIPQRLPSLETESEIVVPIRVNGKIVGEIDIDSHDRKAFGAEDRSFLEECATLIGSFWRRVAEHKSGEFDLMTEHNTLEN